MPAEPDLKRFVTNRLPEGVANVCWLRMVAEGTIGKAWHEGGRSMDRVLVGRSRTGEVELWREISRWRNAGAVRTVGLDVTGPFVWPNSGLLKAFDPLSPGRPGAHTRAHSTAFINRFRCGLGRADPRLLAALAALNLTANVEGNTNAHTAGWSLSSGAVGMT
jgi:hypothetical protein